jgi:hypothetical protein
MVEVCVSSFLLAFAYQGQNNIVFIEYSSRSLRDFYRPRGSTGCIMYRVHTSNSRSLRDFYRPLK